MITIEDIKKELSDVELTQLSDLNASGFIDEAIVEDAINDAVAFISSFIAVPSNPTPYLKTIAVDMTVYELRRLHDLQDVEVRKSCEAALIKMAKGTIPITTSEPQKPQGTKNAFHHGTKRRISFRGFNHRDFKYRDPYGY